MVTINLPFPIFKSTRDDKRDMEIYEEDLKDYCTLNNWYGPSKQSEAEKWVKAGEAIACLRSSLTPSARTVFKYSLGLSEAEQKKPHLVLQKPCGNIMAPALVCQENGRNFYSYFNKTVNQLVHESLEYGIKVPSVNMKALKMNLCKTSL